MNNDYDHMIEILQTLKDGKTIQVQDMRDKNVWFDIKVDDYIPKFLDYEYRIKPEMVRNKVGLFKDETGFYSASLIPEIHVKNYEIENK